ncbi:MAG: tetratricopeptide repeat protein [Bacteroidia bacterium]|nr:tetratricopeptide repeat protein [Bacteroidia bacterium]
MNLSFAHGILATIVLLLHLTAALPAQDTRESADFKLAVRLYNDKLYGQAEEQFKSFINRFPNSASSIEARFYLGLLQKEAKKYGEAKSTFQDFALRFSDHSKAPDAWWNLAEVYAAEHNYPEAGQALAKLKSFHPRSPKAAEALLLASRHFLRTGDTDNARTVLNAVLIEYPQSAVRAEAQFELGRMYLAAGDPDRAMREFRRLQTETIPAELRARTLAAIGQAQSELGNRSEAEARLNEVVTTYPATAAAQEARVLLADLQKNFREFDKAAQNYRAVAENSAAPAELRMRAFIGTADAAMANKNSAGALAAYDALFKQFSSGQIEPSMIRSAAQAARHAGDHMRAQGLLENLLADTLVAVDRRAVMAELGDIARDGRSFAAAVAWYRRYVQQYPADPGAPFALLRIAEINEKDLRNNSEALTLYASVIERFGTTRVADDAQFARARALEAQGRGDIAAEAYAQLAAQYPASEHAREALRRASALRGGTGAASGLERVAEAIAALQDKPGDGRVDLLLGHLYLFDLKQYEKAARSFERAGSRGVTGSDAEEAAWGSAMAAIRMAEAGQRPVAEAAQRCESFFTSFSGGERRDELGWALLQLQTISAQPADALAAASRFLALQPEKYREDARLISGDALLALGRIDEADKEYSAILGTSGQTLRGAEAWYGRARVRQAQRRFEEALSDLAAYESAAPDGVKAAEAMHLRAQLLERTGRYAEAVDVYQRLASRFVYSAYADSARLAEPRALVAAGDAERASARAFRSLREVEDNPFLRSALGPEYLYNYAVTMAQARDRAGARKALTRYLREYPDGQHTADVYFALGQMYRDEGKVDLASSYLQQAATLRESPEARRSAADMLLESGRFDAATAQYEKLAAAATLPQERQYAQSRIVVSLYRAGKLQDADKAAADFLSAHSGLEAAKDEFALEKGKLYFRQSDYRKAADFFDDVEDSDLPDLAALGMFWLGKTLEAQSKNSDAVKQFNDVVKKYPRTEAAVEAMMSLARMSMRAENYQEAATQFKSVVDAGSVPDAVLKEALNGLIKAYEGLSVNDAAAEMTRKFIETWPEDPTAFRKKVNLGVYYYQLRYFDRAITHLESLLSEAAPDDQAEIRYYIGESYFYKGDFNQAALEFLKVPYLVIGKTEIDWSASSYYMAGRAYEELSRPALAVEMYQKIIDTPGVDPRFRAEAEKNLARVRALLE